jgi:hypothetical protein
MVWLSDFSSLVMEKTVEQTSNQTLQLLVKTGTWCNSAVDVERSMR